MNGEPILPPALVEQIVQVVFLVVAAAVGWVLRNWTTKAPVPAMYQEVQVKETKTTIDDRMKIIVLDLITEAGRQKGLLPASVVQNPSEQGTTITFALKPPVLEQVK